MNEERDQNLVKRTLRGDKTAFEMIVRKYQHPLLNYLGRMVGQRETALDFTQEVFIKAYASLRSYKPRYKFSTWLFKIASNLVIDHWRKKKITALSLSEPLDREDDGLTLEVPDDEPSISHAFELGEMRRRIETAMEKLPVPLRELFIWRHVNELSYEEMAEIKNLPLGTVKNRVFQAKEMIRRLLENTA
ncbi:MAG: sigma-70 family RNA polymerase sigma factor [Candidatus Aminicenantes bacterium]|nr:sigma-70 family RNA polymerase sigma factor [Candidatus Aminicenantes bacterium]